MEDLQGRVAVITGGAGGIGAALAARAGREGMRVVVSDIDRRSADAVVSELVAGGVDAVAIETDVRDPDAVEGLAAAVDDRFGGTHVLFNNAGVGLSRGLLWEETLEDWEWVVDVDLWGAIHVLRSFVPRMLAHGEPGHIVNTASMAGIIPGPGMAAYRVAKSGVVGLTETLYADLQLIRAPIGVTLLCPGWVRTGINDSARFQSSAAAGFASAHGEFLAGLMKDVVDSGRDPADVTDLVFAAIASDQFYVFTHPEWNKAITYRAQNMINGVNPPPGPMTKAAWEQLGH